MARAAGVRENHQNIQRRACLTTIHVHGAKMIISHALQPPKSRQQYDIRAIQRRMNPLNGNACRCFIVLISCARQSFAVVLLCSIFGSRISILGCGSIVPHPILYSIYMFLCLLSSSAEDRKRIVCYVFIVLFTCSSSHKPTNETYFPNSIILLAWGFPFCSDTNPISHTPAHPHTHTRRICGRLLSIYIYCSHHRCLDSDVFFHPENGSDTTLRTFYIDVHILAHGWCFTCVAQRMVLEKSLTEKKKTIHRFDEKKLSSELHIKKKLRNWKHWRTPAKSLFCWI